MLNVYYTPACTLPLNEKGDWKNPPSFIYKSFFVVKHWLNIYSTQQKFEVVSAPSAPVSELYLVHEKNYIDQLFSLREDNGFGLKSQTYINTLLPQVGCVQKAVSDALLKKEIVIAPFFGAHHAGFNFNSGHCTINTLIYAAQKALRKGLKKILILDLDQHFGDGTEQLLNQLQLNDKVFHYSYAKQIKKALTPEVWLQNLKSFLKLNLIHFDFVIYNAGIDVLIDDQYGGLLSSKQLAQREDIVFKALKKVKKPALVFLAGGYIENNTNYFQNQRHNQKHNQKHNQHLSRDFIAAENASNLKLNKDEKKLELLLQPTIKYHTFMFKAVLKNFWSA